MSLPTDMVAHNRALIETFRADDGASLGDRPLLLLTTLGRRTGERRTSPLMYVRQDGRLLVIASNNGATTAPAWFLNLVASPAVTVELPGETFDATAIVLHGDERDQAFADIVNSYPFFADHQERAGRVIPVVALVRQP